MGKVRFALLTAAVLAIGGASLWAFFSNAPKAAPTREMRSRVQKKASQKKKPLSAKVKRHSKKPRVTREVLEAHKPRFDIGAAEKELNEEQRKLLEEIRAALRADDYRKLMRHVRQLQTSKEWPDGIHKAIKIAALKALGWYGGKTLPEIVGFLADLDREVVETASAYWDDAIAELDHDVDLLNADGSVKEAGIATNIKNASKIVNDAETMESILSETGSSLRHSVAVETIKYVMENGNKTAQGKIQSVIEDLTGKSDISTAEQLDEWLKQNPDDADDDFMYGGKEDAIADDD